MSWPGLDTSAPGLESLNLRIQTKFRRFCDK
jgi:hypothetical protein